MTDYPAGRPFPREDLQPYLAQMQAAINEAVANYRATHAAHFDSPIHHHPSWHDNTAFRDPTRRLVCINCHTTTEERPWLS